MNKIPVAWLSTDYFELRRNPLYVVNQSVLNPVCIPLHAPAACMSENDVVKMIAHLGLSVSKEDALKIVHYVEDSSGMFCEPLKSEKEND